MPKPMAPPRSPWEARLREHMAAAGIDTYKDLAARAGISRIAINNACAAKPTKAGTPATLSYPSAAAIAKALGITTDQLME